MLILPIYLTSERESENWIDVTYNLKVRNADVEALVHVGVPHNPDIGDKEGSEITLKERKHQSR